jgi:hypothetical protein
MGAGLFRLVCSNGLTVPTSVAEKFSIRHNHFSYDDVKELADSFSQKLPKIEASVNRMMERQLTEKEKLRLVGEAVKIRWAVGSQPQSLDMSDILTPFRSEDEGDDLWKVFNVVQEKFVRGGVEYKSQSGRKTGLRGLKNIMAVNAINTKLWETAESMI